MVEKIGFWVSPEEPTLPDPRNLMDQSLGVETCRRICEYLRAPEFKDPRGSYRGFSWCRICGERGRTMGNGEFSDGIYRWPEGYAHYVEKHCVRPPADLLERVVLREGVSRCSP